MTRRQTNTDETADIFRTVLDRLAAPTDAMRAEVEEIEYIAPEGYLPARRLLDLSLGFVKKLDPGYYDELFDDEDYLWEREAIDSQLAKCRVPDRLIARAKMEAIAWRDRVSLELALLRLTCSLNSRGRRYTAFLYAFPRDYSFNWVPRSAVTDKVALAVLKGIGPVYLKDEYLVERYGKDRTLRYPPVDRFMETKVPMLRFQGRRPKLSRRRYIGDEEFYRAVLRRRLGVSEGDPWPSTAAENSEK